MAARGSQFSRIIAWLKVADIEEVRYILTRGEEIIGLRQEAERDRPPQAEAPKPRRTRRSTITGSSGAVGGALGQPSIPAGTSAE